MDETTAQCRYEIIGFAVMGKLFMVAAKAIMQLLPFCLVIMLWSCDNRKRSPFIPLKNGFGYVHIESSIDVAATAELYYKEASGNEVLIWKNPIDMNEILIHGNMALFRGYKLSDDKSKLVCRLFAAKAPNAAIDITDAVLNAAIEQTNYMKHSKEFLIANAVIGKVQEERAEISVLYLVQAYGSPEILAKFRWDQIEELIKHGTMADNEKKKVPWKRKRCHVSLTTDRQ